MSTKWERTHRRLLDVAHAMVSDRPEHLVTMEEVAKGAGISRQALYNHFPSKNHLMVAVVDDVHQVHDGDVSLEAINDHDHPHDSLRAAARRSMTHHHHLYPAGRSLLSHRRHDDTVAAAHDARRQRRRSAHLKLAQRLHSGGSLRDGLDPDTAADLIDMLHSMEVYEMLVIDGGWDPDDYENELFEVTKRVVLEPSLH
ncbi:MAG: TetR/AcrR family transcriptional regulator [Acidimicrobiia bacterium]|nr:TetR/AcrR family transcriptional regulator [Acidimicrobiia bacterium]